MTAQLNNLTNPNIRFNSLDGIRGILALTVLFSHTIGVATGWTEQRPLVGAYISVIYFFMMSGFVLTHAHRVSHKFLPYLLFRLARLWPLHVISIILMIVIYTYNKHVGGYIPGLYFLNWKVILENIAFLHGITPLDFPLINEPSWSISIEFWASLLVPIIFIRIPLLKRLFFSVSILLFLCLKSKTGFSSSEFNGMFPFLLALCCMMLGSTVYAFASSKWLKPIIEKNFFEIFLWVCFAFCLIGIYGQTHNRLDFIYIIPFLPLMLTDLQPETSYFRRFLSSPIMQFLGFISFPLYLLHSSAIIIGMEYRIDSQILSILMASGLSIVVSYIYATYFDIPLYYLLKKNIKSIFNK